MEGRKRVGTQRGVVTNLACGQAHLLWVSDPAAEEYVEEGQGLGGRSCLADISTEISLPLKACFYEENY